MKPFIDMCLDGEADPEEIGNYVENWHKGNDPRSLYDFLGMTKYEYENWVLYPGYLMYILADRRT